VVIQGILQYWPVQSSTKELLFLNELDELLEVAPKQQLEQIETVLFTQIAQSIASDHFQVAERALFLWNNDNVSAYTNEHVTTILPILYPALAQNSKHHWNPTVHSLTFNVIKMFMDLNAQLFDKESKNYDKKFADEQQSLKTREDFWNSFLAKEKGT
jgi:serine/threonine-protein phosphatase 2A regulatory subunit B'